MDDDKQLCFIVCRGGAAKKRKRKQIDFDLVMEQKIEKYKK